MQFFMLNSNLYLNLSNSFTQGQKFEKTEIENFKE